MKALNKSAEKTFRKILSMLGDRDHIKIDNSDGVFMPLNVDFVSATPAGMIYAFAHNFVQEGDVMADPDMQFLITGMGIYPLTFQQDSVALHQEAVTFDATGNIKGIRPRMQAELTSFANMWMRNIKAQQQL